MTAPLVFLDTETTGLTLRDDIWEFAAIRREPDGTETEHHFFIEHSIFKCSQLPPAFQADHVARFPAYHGEIRPANVKSKQEAAELICDLFREGRPHVVGAVPNFDTERIAKLCGGEIGEVPAWHYHLIDVENLAVGYLAGRGGVLDCEPPWKSDVIAELVGVTITEEERHTAMGDARWAMRIYDAVMGGA